MSEGEIAPATREILRRQRNVQVLLGLVDDIDLTNRVVKWRFHNDYHETGYDSLIVAAGAGQSYFGNDQFATFAPGMKTIDDALELRARIFKAFEVAEFTTDPEERRRLLTFVVVGAGPTGVEMAGQIRELANSTLADEFRSIDSTTARVVLVDGASQVLPPFGKELGERTRKVLERLGVEVELNSIVTNVDEDGIEIRDKDGGTHRIEAVCKVWAAGVKGSELGEILAEQSGAELDRTNRVIVEPDLTLPATRRCSWSATWPPSPRCPAWRRAPSRARAMRRRRSRRGSLTPTLRAPSRTSTRDRWPPSRSSRLSP
nr:FAD-dependent oxidoreductase [Tessaracoccus coleopterorum]